MRIRDTRHYKSAVWSGLSGGKDFPEVPGAVGQGVGDGAVVGAPAAPDPPEMAGQCSRYREGAEIPVEFVQMGEGTKHFTDGDAAVGKDNEIVCAAEASQAALSALQAVRSGFENRAVHCVGQVRGRSAPEVPVDDLDRRFHLGRCQVLFEIVRIEFRIKRWIADPEQVMPVRPDEDEGVVGETGGPDLLYDGRQQRQVPPRKGWGRRNPSQTSRFLRFQFSQYRRCFTGQVESALPPSINIVEAGIPVHGDLEAETDVAFRKGDLDCFDQRSGKRTVRENHSLPHVSPGSRRGDYRSEIGSKARFTAGEQHLRDLSLKTGKKLQVFIQLRLFESAFSCGRRDKAMGTPEVASCRDEEVDTIGEPARRKSAPHIPGGQSRCRASHETRQTDCDRENPFSQSQVRYEEVSHRDS